MFGKVSEKITNSIVKSGTVNAEDKELYLFGIQQGLTLLLNIGTTIAVGLLLDTLWQLTIFTVALIALKSYSGGYHARTPQRCYVVSTLVTITVSLLIKYAVLNMFVYIGLLALSGMVIMVFSPVGSENKPLDDLEKKVYRKRALIICTIEILVSTVLLFVNLQSAVCVVWNLTAVSIMIVVVKIGELARNLFKKGWGSESKINQGIGRRES